MLKSITLENYKCFKDKTTIDFAPLTVLCGVNSSGKSSILKSLLMLKQSFEDNPTKGEILFVGKDVDNGTFKDIVFNNESGKVKLISTFQIGKHKYDWNMYHIDFTDYKNLSKVYENVYTKQPTLFEIKVEIVINGNVNPSTPLQALKNTISNYNISISCYDGKICKENHIGNSELSISFKKGKYKINLIDFPLNINNGDIERRKISETIDKCSCYFDGIKILKIYSDNPPLNIDMNDFLPNIYILFDVISNQFYNIKHMSPLREDPSRRYLVSQRLNEVEPSGENFAQILAQFKSLKKEYCFIQDFDNVFNIKKEKTNLLTATQKWAHYLNVGSLNVKHKEEILKVDIDNHNLLDVGFGVSQSLPILVSGLFAPVGSTIFFEQPEIHLHPKVQMNMADYLLSLSLSGKNVIVETHSDHLINRLVRRCMESDDFRRIVQIYFVDKNDEGVSKVQSIEIDPIHGAICENENFFYQFASETEKIIDIGYRNLQRKKEGANNV